MALKCYYASEWPMSITRQPIILPRSPCMTYFVMSLSISSKERVRQQYGELSRVLSPSVVVVALLSVQVAACVVRKAEEVDRLNTSEFDISKKNDKSCSGISESESSPPLNWVGSWLCPRISVLNVSETGYDREMDDDDIMFTKMEDTTNLELWIGTGIWVRGH